MPDALALVNVKKMYQQGNKSLQVINDISLTIQPGNVFSFLGPNGSGKTTILKLIAGLIKPSHGKIYINGCDLDRDYPAAMRQIGAVLEGARNIYWQLSAWDNLMYFGRLKGCYSNELQKRATMLLHDLDIWQERHEKVGDFSRGLQQKVAIACSLIADPSILLLDEPTLGLDLQASRTLKSWLSQLAKEYNKTIILASHQLDTAEQLCDKIGILHKGKLIAEKSIIELRGILKKNDYQIKILGILNQEQTILFQGFTIKTDADKTILHGSLPTPNDLYPIIEKIKGLGLSLFSANKLDNNLEDIICYLTANQHVS